MRKGLGVFKGYRGVFLLPQKFFGVAKVSFCNHMISLRFKKCIQCSSLDENDSFL